MKTADLGKLLRGNAYPGRGIVLGLNDDGKNSVVAYFIMGRSENSRNRVFTLKGEGIETEAFDPSKLTDPSLIIYAPVRVAKTADGEERTIVTNGDQTDTVYDYLTQGKTFEDALRTRMFEPDAPNFTPRISGLLDNLQGSYQLSILKSLDGDPAYPVRQFFDYSAPKPGVGHLLHTYRQDGNPIPSYEGEPTAVALTGTIDELTRTLWENLNEQNRVSLFVRYVDRQSGHTETRIVNKNH